MTAPPVGPPPRPRVVIGVDDSPGARAGLRWGLPEAVRRGARVQVVAAFTIDHYWSAPYMAGAFPYEEIRDDTARRARQVVAEVTAELVAAGSAGVDDLTVDVVTEAGSPALELVERSRGAPCWWWAPGGAARCGACSWGRCPCTVPGTRTPRWRSSRPRPRTP